MKLITEFDSALTDYELILEQKNPNEPSSYYLEGPMIVAGVKNQNGRIYDQKLMETAVKKFKTTMIDTRRSLGELNHPTSASINIERAVHLIQELNQKGNVWYGKSKLLTGTKHGDLCKSLIFDHGVKLGMSTRGAGSLSENGMVDQDYVLTTIDLVQDPSALQKDGTSMWMNGILESKNFMIDNHGELVEIAYNKVEKDLKTLPIRSTDRNLAIKNIFNNFISSL